MTGSETVESRRPNGSLEHVGFFDGAGGKTAESFFYENGQKACHVVYKNGIGFTADFYRNDGSRYCSADHTDSLHNGMLHFFYRNNAKAIDITLSTTNRYGMMLLPDYDPDKHAGNLNEDPLNYMIANKISAIKPLLLAVQLAAVERFRQNLGGILDYDAERRNLVPMMTRLLKTSFPD